MEMFQILLDDVKALKNVANVIFSPKNVLKL